MYGQNGHRRVELKVREWQSFRDPLIRLCQSLWTLTDHFGGGLKRGDHPVGRLVGSGSGADIQNGLRVAQGSMDRFCDPRVWLAQLRVPNADRVIERTHGGRV